MKIIKIEIENFFAIEKAEIKPAQNDKILITGINHDDEGADNSGAGKSSLMASIGWAIFGEVPKNTSVEKVIRFGTEQTSVKITFDDDTYIERRRGKKNSLDFWYQGEDNTKRTVSLTQQEIFNKFGMKGTPKQCYLDFLNTIFLNSNTVETFSSTKFTSADRFEFISRVFNLSIWKELSEKAKEEKKKWSEKVESVQVKIDAKTEQIEGVSLKDLIKNKKWLEQQIKDIKFVMEQVNENIKKIEAENAKGAHLFTDVLQLESELTNLQSSIDIKKDALKTKGENLADKLDIIIKAQKGLKIINESEDSWTKEGSVERIKGKIEKLREEEKKTHDNYTKVQNELENYKNKEELIENQIKNHIQCPYCNNDVLISNGELSKYNDEKIKLELNSFIGKISSFEYDEHRLLEKTKEKKEKIKEGEDILEKAQQIERDRIQYANDLKDTDTIYERQEDLKEEYDTFKAISKADLDEKKSELTKARVKRDAFQEINTHELEVEYNDHVDEQQQFNQDLGATEKSIKDLTLAKEALKLLEDSIKETRKNLQDSAFWVKGFIDVRRMVIESALPNLESSINLYLTKLKMPLRVIIDTLRETGEGKLKDEFNINVKDLTTGRTDIMETYSDGQKKRIGLAICFALNDLLRDKEYPFDFLLIDQLIDNDIDDIGIDRVMDILDSTDKQKFIISHRPELKDVFKNVIWCEMQNGVTKINNQS